jgi:GntP family gluconate:H+ symporter
MEFYQAAVAVFAFGLIVILNRRVKLPVVLALLVGGLAFALLSRESLGASGEAMSLGFAQTVESLGFSVIAGAIVTAMLERTGIADRIAVIGKLDTPGGRSTSVVLGLCASFVPSAPVALALLRPWCRVLRGPSAASRAAGVTTMALALSAGQAFIYPSVIVLATGTILKIKLVPLLLIGVPLAIVTSVVGAWFVARMAPRVAGTARCPARSGSDAPPAAATADMLSIILPTLLPIALLSVASYAQMATEPLGRDGRDILGFYAKPRVILVLCLGMALLGALRSRATTPGSAGWIETAFAVSVGPLLATGIAGGFAAVLQNTGMAEQLAERVFELRLGIFVPFLAAALMKTLHGSSLVATLTAAGMLEPLLPALGLDAASGRVLAACAIGAGTLISHVNDPYFWLVADIAELNPVQALRLHSAGTVVQAGASIVLLLILGLTIL